ncbi:MAG: PAS domain S-box protein, partial [Deltaproteobacteria bacterium]|nr:PAS domain S-box protein [Deltaproteobacteria bacterium]
MKLRNSIERPLPVVLPIVFGLSAFLFLLVAVFPSRLYTTLDAATYLILHNIIELFSVLVSLSIFGVGWYAFDQSKNHQALFLSTACLAIGLMDLMHTLSFPGMPNFITPSSTNKGILFWISARLTSAVAFFTSAYIYPESVKRGCSKFNLLTAALAVTGLVFVGVFYFPGYLPAMFIEGSGLTPIKVCLEYLVVSLFALSFAAYWKRFTKTGDRVLIWYLAAFIVCIFSELAFTLYKSAYDTYNLLGHLYKLAAFYMIYQGIFTISVKHPYLQLVDTSEKLRIGMAERRRAEEALRESEQRFREVFDNTSNCLFLLDLTEDGRFKFAGFNPAAENAIGIPNCEASGKLVEEVLSEELAEAVIANYRRCVETGRLLDYEQKLNLPVGPRYFHTTLVPVRNMAGGIYRLLAVASDITANKEAEQSLALMNFALDKVHDAAYLIDEHARFLYVNEESCRELRYSRDELLGLSVAGVDPDYPVGRWSGHWRDLKEHGSLTFEGRHRAKDGHIFPVEISANYFEFDGQGYNLAMVRDITERKRAEEELIRYRDHLEDLVKLRTAELTQANIRLQELDRLKSMFIASMSHELRTPLNTIIGFTGMTLNGLSGPLNEEQEDNLRRVYRSSRHLLNLITDVIDISKIEAGRINIYPEQLMLADLVAEAVEAVQPQLREKGLTLEVEAPAGLAIVTDRKRLLQCLLNFLSNAVKFTEAGQVAVSVREVNDQFEISVSDTGIGIAEQDLPRLFEAFERLDSHLRVKAGGTGLG